MKKILILSLVPFSLFACEECIEYAFDQQKKADHYLMYEADLDTQENRDHLQYMKGRSDAMHDMLYQIMINHGYLCD